MLQQGSYVDIRPLKMLAKERLGESTLVRRVLLVEADFMSAVDYCAKLGTWLALLREERLA